MHKLKNSKEQSAEKPELSKISSLRTGVGQNIALHVSPAARKRAFQVHSASFALSFFRLQVTRVVSSEPDSYSCVDKFPFDLIIMIFTTD